MTGSHPLGHAGVTGGTVVSEDIRKTTVSESGAQLHRPGRDPGDIGHWTNGVFLSQPITE